MRRLRWLLPPLIALLLISCQTERARSYTEEETERAFSVLSSDMIDYITPGEEIDGKTMEGYLPSSFTAYSDIVPLYDEIASGYAEDVAKAVSPLIEDAYPAVKEAMAAIASSHPVALIPGDTAFTEELERVAGEEVRRVYLSSLSSLGDALSKAFASPYSVFTAVRKAYSNLSSVGGEMDIPYPVPFTASSLSYILSDVLFSRLAEAERELKNRPLSDIGSPYAVFWEV